MEIIENQRSDLPNATAVLVLGILFLVFCWYYGFLGLILGIVTVVLASNQRKLYRKNPEKYTESSFRNLNSGRICGIIAICLSSLVIVGWILVMIGIFTFAAFISM